MRHITVKAIFGCRWKPMKLFQQYFIFSPVNAPTRNSRMWPFWAQYLVKLNKFQRRFPWNYYAMNIRHETLPWLMGRAQCNMAWKRQQHMGNVCDCLSLVCFRVVMCHCCCERWFVILTHWHALGVSDLLCGWVSPLLPAVRIVAGFCYGFYS